MKSFPPNKKSAAETSVAKVFFSGAILAVKTGNCCEKNPRDRTFTIKVFSFQSLVEGFSCLLNLNKMDMHSDELTFQMTLHR